MTDKKPENKPDKEMEEKQAQLQQKYMEMQMLDQQMKQMQKQAEAIEKQAAELEEVQQSLDDLANSKQGADMFVPISSGIFLKAKLDDNAKLAVNVGSGTVVSKDIPSTKAMLEEQANEMRKFQKEINTQFDQMAGRMSELQKELQGIVGV